MNIGSKVKNSVVYFRKKTYKYEPEKINIESSNDLIINLISNGSGGMVTRLGSVELQCLYEYYNKQPFSKDTVIKMRNNAGFFPNTTEMLNEFCNLYTESLHEADLIGIWYNKGENKIINSYSKNAKLCELRSLEPYYNTSTLPWSYGLKGKKVLVIHPFANSISYQYSTHRDGIFRDENILPRFNLMTMKAVQSISGNTEGYENWFEALEYMKNQIDLHEYDVAIIGAGAYGLPLAAHIKSKGKTAIHLGGSTQILFGIKGKRWDNHPFISNLYNDSWIRPQESEVPKDFKKVEGGCYW